MSRRGVLLVGCGNIADRYAEDIARQPSLRLVGAVDLDPQRAAGLAARHGVRSFDRLDEALADDEVEIVANLTGHEAHVAVSRAAMGAGRHVFSEKPMALNAADARSLLALAEARGVRIAAAPIVLLGELAQTAGRWVSDGRLGGIRLVYAEVNWGRIESWHANPVGFYDVGPLLDVGVYPLTLVTGLLGPVRRVSTAFATTLLGERRTTTGRSFSVRAPDYVNAVLELESGTIVRLTANFYVVDPARQRGVELHGDKGSLWISNWFQFAGTLEHAPLGGTYRPVPLLREPETVIPWAAGLQDLAESLDEGRSPRTDGAFAAHVIEVIDAIQLAAAAASAVDVQSRPPLVPPPAWVEEQAARAAPAEAKR